MALSPSSPRQQDVAPRDPPPPTSQLLERELGGFGEQEKGDNSRQNKGRSSNGAKVDAARKTKEINHLLAKLEKEGMEIDGKVASIIDDGIARIKAEATRENINEPKRNRIELLLIIASMAVGFVWGVEWRENSFRKEDAKMRHA